VLLAACPGFFGSLLAVSAPDAGSNPNALTTTSKPNITNRQLFPSNPTNQSFTPGAYEKSNYKITPATIAKLYALILTYSPSWSGSHARKIN
jgi:hypothetical protein